MISERAAPARRVMLSKLSARWRQLCPPCLSWHYTALISAALDVAAAVRSGREERMRDRRLARRPFGLQRRSHGWASSLVAPRLGEGALASAALVFVLSACVSYGVITGFAASSPEPGEVQLASVAASGPPNPAEFFGPELPAELPPVEADEPEPSTMRVVTGHIGRGSTLAKALGEQSVAAQAVEAEGAEFAEAG